MIKIYSVTVSLQSRLLAANDGKRFSSCQPVSLKNRTFDVHIFDKLHIAKYFLNLCSAWLSRFVGILSNKKKERLF